MTKHKNHHQQVLQLFKEHFKGKETITGIEIGTMAGDLTKALLSNFPNLFLFTIDPWEHRDGDQFEAGNTQEYHNKQKEAALKKLDEFGSRVGINQVTSDRFIINYEYNIMPVDFVWIDGHHSEEQVRKDIHNYRILVKPGGILGGHDYNLVPDVTKVVDEEYGPDKLNTGWDYTWWIIKE